jgi:4-hydroxy-tetrahydrodipicolinate synthase
VQVILPDWSPVTNEEAISYLQLLASHAQGIGLVLYNPPHAKRRLAPRDFAAIKRAVPSLVGLKVAGGDGAWYAEMRDLLPDLSIFVPGHTLASGFRQGANGAYSNVACLNPGAAQRWCNQMHSDIDAALELESRIRRFFDECMLPNVTDAGYSNQAIDKLLACIGAWSCLSPRLRWPYKGIPAGEVQRHRARAEALLPEFFSRRDSNAGN